MVQINFARKEINCKIVYYGPGLSGKTTNLEMVHEKAPKGSKGDLTSISTDGDRTLFFDFMPLDLGSIAGMRTKFHIYTVPGQVYYNSTRKLVLLGADGVIFVADSSPGTMETNKQSLENLKENLAEMGKDIAKIPLVIQWNKRDIEGAMDVETLEQELNTYNAPTLEAVAAKGEGVIQTLKSISSLVLESINTNERGGSLMSPAMDPMNSQVITPLPPQQNNAPVATGSSETAPVMQAPVSEDVVADSSLAAAAQGAQPAPMAQTIVPAEPAPGKLQIQRNQDPSMTQPAPTESRVPQETVEVRSAADELAMMGGGAHTPVETSVQTAPVEAATATAVKEPPRQVLQEQQEPRSSVRERRHEQQARADAVLNEQPVKEAAPEPRRAAKPKARTAARPTSQVIGGKPKKKKKSSAGGVIAIIVVTLLLIGAGVAYYLMMM